VPKNEQRTMKNLEIIWKRKFQDFHQHPQVLVKDFFSLQNKKSNNFHLTFQLPPLLEHQPSTKPSNYREKTSRKNPWRQTGPARGVAPRAIAGVFAGLRQGHLAFSPW